MNFPQRFNLAAHLLDQRVREGRGDAIAISTLARDYSYRDCLGLAERASHALRAAGLAPAHRVLVVLPDGIGFVTALFAALKLGAVVAMGNPEAPLSDLEALLRLTRARALVTTATLAAALRTRFAGEAPALFVTADDGDDSVPALPADTRALFAARTDAPTAFINADTRADDVAMWLFTSGSTGQARAALHRHRDFAAHTEAYARGVLALAPTDVTLAVPRLHFPYATGMNLMFPFAVGARAVLCPQRPAPRQVFALLERFTPTVFTTVPTMTAKMLAVPADERPARLRGLRLAVSAGEALPADLFRRWQAAYQVPMLDGIGSAEMFHIFISNRPDDARPGCHGRLVPGYQARIVRDDGREASAGEAGTLWVRGPSAAIGYHDEDERTRQVFRDGWVVTGDVFRRDEQGYFFYEGRGDDLMKVAGLYVSPLEVEAVLREHPAVEDCAVVGARDADGLEQPRAFLVLRDGQGLSKALTSALDDLVRARLAAYKRPRTYLTLPALPRNDRGKILRRRLREGHEPIGDAPKGR